MKIRHKARGKFRQIDQKKTRERNSPENVKEVARRDARYLARVRAGSHPYTPAVMSWLSRRLDKPASRITPTDVKNLLRKPAASGGTRP
jgi:hypothetical protein